MFTVARFREVSDTLGDRAVLLSGVPASSPSPAAALRFGPDGKLYAAFDDGGEARRRSTRTDTFRPVALGWDPPTDTLCVIDRAAGASPLAFYRGALFPAWAGRLLSASDHMVGARLPAARIVAGGPDGAIYCGTARSVWRLAPERGA